MKFTGRIDDGEAIDTTILGSKAANLIQLASAGYPVPLGFYTTADAYKHLMNQTGLFQVADDLLHHAYKDHLSLTEASSEIRDLIEQQPLPVEIAADMVDSYAELGRRTNCHILEMTPVSIRSSPLCLSGEPGIQCPALDTFLNCCGTNMLLQLTRRCWSSLWSAAALDQRRRLRIDHQDLAVALIVQVMVNPRASGILSTTNPHGAGTSECCITAAWGLSPAQDSTGAGQDVLRVDKRNGRLLSYKNGDKRRRRVLSKPCGTRVENVPEAFAGQPVLTEEQAAYLAALGSRIERFFGMPLELVWAQEAGRWYILSVHPPAAVRHPDAQLRTKSHREGRSRHRKAANLKA